MGQRQLQTRFARRQDKCVLRCIQEIKTCWQPGGVWGCTKPQVYLDGERWNACEIPVFTALRATSTLIKQCQLLLYRLCRARVVFEIERDYSEEEEEIFYMFRPDNTSDHMQQALMTLHHIISLQQ